MIHTLLEQGVYHLVFNRPEKRNALTPDMLDAAIAAVQAIPTEARVVLLRGEGAFFCSGFDLKLCVQQPGTLERLLRGLARIVAMLRYEQDKPVIIAAQGAAIAGGCALLGAGDVVITDRQAKIGYPVTPLGVSPAVSAAFLRHCIPDGATRTRQLDPALISGEHATQLGLCHECVESPAEVTPRALEIAMEWAAKPPGAMQATRRWLGEIERSLPDTKSAAGYTAHETALTASLSLVENEEQRSALGKLFPA